MMRYYTTEYIIGNEKYAAGFVAANDMEACALCQDRGIGEVVCGSVEMDDKITVQQLHAICFMAFIAVKSGKFSIDEVLSDRGVLHEAIHLMDGSSDEKTMNEFQVKLKNLINKTHSTALIPAFASVFNSILP